MKRQLLKTLRFINNIMDSTLTERIFSERVLKDKAVYQSRPIEVYLK